MQTPGLGTLGAGVGNGVPAMLELENLDPRPGGVENPLVLEGASHLALQTTGAFVRVDKQ
jgi:hypothetical protein